MIYNFFQHIIHVLKQDITTLSSDGIVFFTDPTLLCGQRGDDFILKKGGRKIIESYKKIGGSAPGDAKITVGGDLPCRYVIHSVIPSDFSGGKTSLIGSCYRESIRIAMAYDLTSIAFPSLTPFIGFSSEELIRLYLDTVLGELFHESRKMEIYFCLSDDEGKELFQRILKERLK